MKSNQYIDKKKINHNIFLIFIVLLIIILTVFSFIFFRIHKVKIYGIYDSSMYSNSIKNSFINNNILFLNNSEIKNAISSKYPFVSYINIEKKYPSTLIIDIKNKNIEYLDKVDLRYYWVSNSGNSIKGYYKSNIPIVYSNTLSHSLLMSELINDISKQFIFSVKKYEVNNNIVTLYLNNGPTVLFNFHKSLITQINQLTGVLTTSNNKCNVINVEFSRIFCQY
jgi:hypothetical protein